MINTSPILEFSIEKEELTIQDIIVVEELSNHYGD